jgi:ABC-2 type transport system permease protein
VNRLRRDEDEGRAGAVLGTSVGRPAWVGGSLAVTAFNSALLLVVSGLALGVGLGASIGEVGLAWELTVAALAYLPITLAFAAVALVAYGAGLALFRRPDLSA